MQYFELVPAYGREYKTKAEVIEAFNANKDFLGDYQLGFQLINKEQIPKPSVVNLRYKKSRFITQVKIN